MDRTAISAVSRSRILPTMILSGAWRRIERGPRANAKPFFSLTGNGGVPEAVVSPVPAPEPESEEESEPSVPSA